MSWVRHSYVGFRPYFRASVETYWLGLGIELHPPGRITEHWTIRFLLGRWHYCWHLGARA